MKLAGILAASIAAGMVWVVTLAVTLSYFADSFDDSKETTQTQEGSTSAGADSDDDVPATKVPDETRYEFNDPNKLDYLHALQTNSAEGIREYWTADRMRKAGKYELPRETYTVRRNSRRGTDETPRSDGTEKGTDRADSVKELGFPRTIGALFFVAPNGQDASCTASVVGSLTDSTIATAAHCVYTPDHGAHTKIMFVPAYDDGAYPEVGTYPALTIRTFLAWADDGSWKYDQAFVEVYENEMGKSIAATVGWNDLVFDHGPRTDDSIVWGYQQIKGRDTDLRPYFCDGKTIAIDHGNDVGIGCTFSHGAAGGPWFTANADQHNGNKVWAITSRDTSDDVLIAARNTPELRTLLAAF